MRRFTTHPGLRACGLCLAGLMLSLSVAAATPTPAAQAVEIQARYERDRNACLTVQPKSERASCLKQAVTDRDSARQAPIYAEATYAQNRLERCRVLSGDEARDCLARMRGEGKVSGSVEGGGIYRETVTIEFGGAEPPVPAASAP